MKRLNSKEFIAQHQTMAWLLLAALVRLTVGLRIETRTERHEKMKSLARKEEYLKLPKQVAGGHSYSSTRRKKSNSMH